MSFIIKLYKNGITKFPVASQAVQTGLLMGFGDFLAQTAVEQKSFKQLDFKRTGQFTLIGTFLVGPPLRIWYGTLDRIYGSSGKIVALKKVATDQICFAPVFLAAILSAISAVQGLSISEVKSKVTRDYPDVLKNNYKVWPAVQLCNFYVVPLQYQVLTVQVVAVFWNTYISWKSNIYTQTDHLN